MLPSNNNMQRCCTCPIRALLKVNNQDFQTKPRVALPPPSSVFSEKFGLLRERTLRVHTDPRDGDQHVHQGPAVLHAGGKAGSVPQAVRHRPVLEVANAAEGLHIPVSIAVVYDVQVPAGAFDGLMFLLARWFGGLDRSKVSN